LGKVGAKHGGKAASRKIEKGIYPEERNNI